MLKHLKFSGIFHDENLSVNVTLENPSGYGLEATTLLFSFTVRDKSSSGITPNLEDFTFYVMDEANRLYNTQSIPIPAVEVDPGDDELMENPDGLIHTDFKHDFLFQDMRIAFDYRPYRKLSIIELKH